MLETPIDFKTQKFFCPHCNLNTKHKWYNLAKGGITDKGFNYYVGFVPDLHLRLCLQCYNFTLWLKEKIIYPHYSKAPPPIEDMPLEIKEIFLEARKIVNQSPKAASALLRIGLRKLINHLGEKSRSLEIGILNLVNKGLPEKFYDAFLTVGVIGKKAAKPGVINNRDNLDTALALFNLINMLVESTISQQRKVHQLFSNIPKPKIKRKKKKIRKKKIKKAKDRTAIIKSDVIPKPTILYR